MDTLNGVFEIGGGFVVWFAIHKLWKDKQVRGGSLITLLFFNAWGFWNLFYYPSLHQPISTIGAVMLTFSNTVQTTLTAYYIWKEKHEHRIIIREG